MRNTKQRSGLILLVVLGMLSLFSMLAITYVVFSAQSRAANVAMARREFRGTPAAKLLDEAAKQLLRSTSDINSVMWRQGLLDDYYGHSTNGPIGVVARTNLRDRPARSSISGAWFPFPVTTGGLESPKLRGTFLRIPLQWNSALPEQDDVLNGRVVTFLAGPLANESFRIIRYIGEVPPVIPGLSPAEQNIVRSCQYSITIDLTKALDRNITFGTATQSLSDWISKFPIENGARLCYNLAAPIATTIPPAAPLQPGFAMQINGAALNAAGSGVGVDGAPLDASTPPSVQTTASTIAPSTQISFAPTLSIPPTLHQAVALLQNFSRARRANAGFEPFGDSDESNDVADVNDFHLAFKQATAADGDGVIPSLHRPAVINQIYSAVAVDNDVSGITTPIQLLGLIELLQRASGRSLSFRVRGLPFALDVDDGSEDGLISQNSNFSGGNLGQFSGGLRTPQLDIDWSRWTSETTQKTNFKNWVRWLTRGPWDVDTNGDGLNDAIWADINLPLITSPEGKLLKTMVAYYVEDLGGRLNLNTSGSFAQSNSNFDALKGDNRFAVSKNRMLPQGMGYGTADINLRHLFRPRRADSTFPNYADVLARYTRFLGERNGASQNTIFAQLTSFGPGTNGNDFQSRLRQRGRLPLHNQLRLPGLPMSVFGRSSLAVDLFGNPVVYDNTTATATLNQFIDDPYEAWGVKESRSDRPITFAEWERLERMFDVDRSNLPSRLERLLFPPETPAVLNGTRYSTAAQITPKSSSTIAAAFAATYQYDRPVGGSTPPVRVERRVSSFLELMEALAQDRFPPTPGTIYPLFNRDALRQLFPVEFSQNLPLDLNRPFGNGIDDDGDGLIDEADESRNQASFYVYNRSGTRDVFPHATIPERYGLRGGSFDPAYIAAITAEPRLTNMFDGDQGRQLLARHLYCLAQLILPDGYKFPNQADPSANLDYGNDERARILAQWAINVVDYRDIDGDMTRFPYDPDPFGASGTTGWTIDTDSPVVWGREQPDLLITESFAFHDTRINEKSNPPDGENIYQQLRLPEGSLFLEYLSTASNDNNSGYLQGVPTGLDPVTASPILYDTSSGRRVLRLGALSPRDPLHPPANNVRYPIFRTLILQPQMAGQSIGEQYSSQTSDTPPLPTRSQMQYQFASEAGLTQDGVAQQVDRVMWFTQTNPTDDNLATSADVILPQTVSQVYNNITGPAFLPAGRYATVGPRAITYVGQREQSNSPLLHRPSGQRIELRPEWTQTWNDENQPGLWASFDVPDEATATSEPEPTPSRFIGRGLSLVAAAHVPSNWMDVNRRVGLNISEPNPNNYYPEPPEHLNTSMEAANTDPDPLTGAPGFGTLAMDDDNKDAYVDLETSADGNSSQDEPLDNDRFLADNGWTIQPDPNARPSYETRTNWSTAVLQRLANPNRAWHAVLNPYITIDWIPIDLTVFNGEERIDDTGAEFRFASRQKTGLGLNPGEAVSAINATQLRQRAGRTFYSYHTGEPQVTPDNMSAAAEPAHFNRTMPVEYTDRPDEPDSPLPRLGPTGVNHTGDFNTLGYLNSYFGLRGMNGESTHGEYFNTPVFYQDAAAFSSRQPSSPTAPSVANRNFVSALELMNIPLSSPGQIMQDFTASAPTGSPTFLFGHLLDFDMIDSMANDGLEDKTAAALFDLVMTRNPWPDSEKILDPDDVISTGTLPRDGVLNYVMEIYRPPFNRIPSFVEPGKVNINTAAEAGVLRGLMSSAMTPDSDPAVPNFREVGTIPYQSRLIESRGITSPGSALDAPNPNLARNQPTQFPGAFKNGLSSYVSSPIGARERSADTTLMRLSSSERMLNPEALFGSGPIPYSPMLLNYPVTRMNNLVSTNSNVYAVRVTLGFFEFDPATGLGREYGEDEGRVKRHKAFYIMDRSIPVGYIPGEDLNTNDCIIVRRIIE